MVDVGGQIICGLYDPCDYVQTGVNIVQGEAGVLETFAMATPILPAVVGRWGDDLLGWGSDVVQWAGNKIDDAIGAFCSVSEDTLVMTEDGLMPISEVGLYEKVLAYNEETGEVGYYPVVAVWAYENPVIVTLTIEGETIETTPEHPFYTDEGEWLPAASLQVGDEIRTSDWGTGTVEAIQFTHNPQLMYNFTVATAHTYFVGEGQWLVHNECPWGKAGRTAIRDFINSSSTLKMVHLESITENLGLDPENILLRPETRNAYLIALMGYVERHSMVAGFKDEVLRAMQDKGVSQELIDEFLNMISD